MILRPLTLALLLAATAGGAAARAPKAPAVAVPAGKPVDCISIPAIRESRVRDDRTIDFFVGRTVYRNTLPQRCPELGFERAFSYKTSLSQLCSVDIITVFRNGGGGPRSGASCGLGQFQPVTGIR